MTIPVSGQLTLSYDITGDGVVFEYRQLGNSPLYGGGAMYDGGNMYKNDDPFLPLSNAQNITAGIYEFRVTTAASAARGIVNSLAISIDVPDIEIDFTDVIVPPAGIRLPLPYEFYEISSVYLTMISDGGTAIVARVMDRNPVTGPLIQAFDTSNTATTGKVCARIKGYVI